MRPETLFAPPRGEAAREHAPRQAAWATRAADGAPGTHGDPDAQLELAAAKSEEGWEAIAAKRAVVPGAMVIVEYLPVREQTRHASGGRRVVCRRGCTVAAARDRGASREGGLTQGRPQEAGAAWRWRLFRRYAALLVSSRSTTYYWTAW